MFQKKVIQCVENENGLQGVNTVIGIIMCVVILSEAFNKFLLPGFTEK